ncbi:hypothetical protein BT69DRAFT_440078 [Atractiella rhizophila]|nr:hypothetical protein BT69DRAFT_440078 [Atractiella rhizophila]
MNTQGLSKTNSLSSRHKKGSYSADLTLRKSTFHDIKVALKKTARKESISVPRKKTEQEKTLITDQLVAALSKLPTAHDAQPTIRHVTLIENQRGLFVFGQPNFSRNILFQWDPHGWTDETHQDTMYDPNKYALPGPQWEWLDDKFYVNMSHNVDERGWQYSVTFRWGKWKGQPDVWKSFVRRRFWVRRMRLLPEVKHYNPEFSDKRTPRSQTTYKPMVKRSDKEFNGRFESGSPVFKLALKEEAKKEFLGWEGIIDVRSPLLPWSYVKAHSSHFDCGDVHGNLENVMRDNVAFFNFQRFSRIIKATQIDRQRLDLWEWWLGVSAEIPEPTDDMETVDGDASLVALQKTMDPAVAWEEDEEPPRPEPDDVWDLVERHLDPILATFQFQRSAIEFLALLKDVHEKEVTNHRHEGSFPKELSPFHLHGSSEEMGPNMKGREKDIWYNRPRYQFWQQVEERKHELRRHEIIRASSSSLT